ncbi:MAG: M28 family metallopeptidase [Gemmatimonadota bacterium]|nr:M28 family metallopeptidase [Gemmatimonadota bacterium]
MRPIPAGALFVALVPLTFVCACGESAGDPGDLDAPEVRAALNGISPGQIEEHIRVLAHDSLEGRGPGTAGYVGAAAYAESVLRTLGLEPFGDDGTFRQTVPLRHGTVDDVGSSLRIHASQPVRDLTYGQDYYLGADLLRTSSQVVEAPVAFVGFGVSAPDLGYDDYGSLDVRGKVVVWLSGAPASFPSNERAYYSSGATKEAEAVRRGAIGTGTFWSPDDPRFRWEVNANRSRRGSFAWLDGGGMPSRGSEQIQASASLNHRAAAALFRGSAVPIEEALAAAASSTPQAFDLATRISVDTRSVHREVESWNVVAKLSGSDPELRDEHVIYVGHIDHFGIGVPVEGDSIYNGAHDNASGVSIVLEIARAFAGLPSAPRRSVVFLIPTAEEWGLLGSDYFVQNPTVAEGDVVGAFSLDMPFLFHPLLDIVPYGAEHSTMGASVAKAADHLGLGLGPDPIPEQVLFIRSDHFSFIRQGIPALFIKSGFETGDPGLDGGEINTAFRQNLYHTPFDEADQGFDFESGAGHARVNFLTGYVIAQDDTRPAWNEGDFFGGLFGPR